MTQQGWVTHSTLLGRTSPELGIFRILARLGLEEQLAGARSARFDHLGFEAEVIGVFAEHGEFVEALEVGGDEETKFVFRIDAATRTEIVRFIDSVETSPADADHLLELVVILVFSDSEECDVVNHEGTGSVVGSISPFEGTFLQGVEIRHEENADKAEHCPEEDCCALGDLFAIDDRPRIEKDDLDIEKNEQHRNEVEFHAEAGLALADRVHPAFVGGVFRPVGRGAFAQKCAGDERGDRETGGDHNLEKDGNVVGKHGTKKFRGADSYRHPGM